MKIMKTRKNVNQTLQKPAELEDSFEKYIA
jgi:hypothetical protein